MLSVNYISNFLQEKQDKISYKDFQKILDIQKEDEYFQNIKKEKSSSIITSISTSTTTLSSSSSINDQTPFIINTNNQKNPLFYFFGENVNNYSIFKKVENKNELFTFLNSIFHIGNEYYSIESFQTKKSIMKTLIKKMDDDIIKKDLYFAFNYDKNRKFNKEKIMKTLQELYRFKVDRDTIALFKQYVADYLGINIFIIGIINNKIDFDNREFYLCHKYGTQFNPYVQSFFLINQDNIYYPLLHKASKEKQNHGFSYDQLQSYLNKILTFYSISLEEKSEELPTDYNEIDTNEIDTNKIDTNEIDTTIKNEIFTENNNESKDELEYIDETKYHKQSKSNDETKSDKESEIEKKKEENTECKIIENKNNEQEIIKTPMYQESMLKKLKIDELKSMATKHNINLQIISPISEKLIFKKKAELIEDLKLI